MLASYPTASSPTPCRFVMGATVAWAWPLLARLNACWKQDAALLAWNGARYCLTALTFLNALTLFSACVVLVGAGSLNWGDRARGPRCALSMAVAICLQAAMPL